MVSLPTEQSCVSFSVQGMCVELAPGTFTVHKSGIEFDCAQRPSCFSVLELHVQSACGCFQADCPGVVVAVEPLESGRHRVTVLFLDLPDEPARG